jgi:hypothetical protein
MSSGATGIDYLLKKMYLHDGLSMMFNYRPRQKKCINLLGNRIKIKYFTAGFVALF